jgi:hypothetical protein
LIGACRRSRSPAARTGSGCAPVIQKRAKMKPDLKICDVCVITL